MLNELTEAHCSTEAVSVIGVRSQIDVHGTIAVLYQGRHDPSERSLL